MKFRLKDRMTTLFYKEKKERLFIFPLSLTHKDSNLNRQNQNL